jgi:alpha-L-rhamnosidase
MSSFNHYSLGSCTEWMYEYCLGIKPHFDAPGFRKVTFRPYFDPTGAITWAKGHYDTDFGRIEVDWSAQDAQFIYRVTVPETIDYHFDFGALTQLSHTQTENTHVFVLAARQ